MSPLPPVTMGTWTDHALAPLPEWWWFWTDIDGLDLRYAARQYGRFFIVDQWGWWLMLWTAGFKWHLLQLI